MKTSSERSVRLSRCKRHCTSDGEPNEDGKDTLGYSWILSDSSRTNKLGKLLLISAHLENKKSDRDSQFNRGRTGGQRGPNEGPFRANASRRPDCNRLANPGD